jgi:hypothetical protein
MNLSENYSELYIHGYINKFLGANSVHILMHFYGICMIKAYFHSDFLIMPLQLQFNN